jgi:hypothetical protein
MKSKMINRERVEGRVYDHNLAIKVTGESSKKPGTEYINGTLDVATDDAGLNIVTVNFTYVTETTSKGNKNATFGVLKNIIENGKTIINDGIENASMVRIDTALGLNDFYTNRNGEETLVSAKRNDGGFVTSISKLSDENSRNTFEFDFLINGTRLVEADPERHIDNDYLVVKGAVFNFRNAILPVELVVKSEGGIKYFESLEVSPQNLVFTKVWGKIESQTIVNKKEEESAFGEAAVKEYTRTIKEWVITGSSSEPYEIGDEENGITKEEIEKAMADREVYLADIKRKQDEYQASKAAAPAAGSASVSAAQGGFNF